MDFRRIPFQFSSTDPAKRQAELQKRFGLQPKQEKMFVDLGNPDVMGTRKESNSASNSPRLQHRVPIFVEGMPESGKSTDANPTNVDAGQKPRVRIVPIEIENSDGSKRHRTYSGSSCVNGNSYQPGCGISDDIKRQRSGLSGDTKAKVEPTPFQQSNGPKVCTIPVKIEGGDKTKKTKAPSPSKKAPTPKVTPMNHQNGNATNDNVSNRKVTLSPVILASLMKIDIVLEKLKSFQSDVEKFSGTVKEKQYKYLDEMLTRLMLDLDNVETMGNENIRLARKAAIKKVQHCIDLLESKVNESSQNQTVCNTTVSESGKESEVVENDDKSSNISTVEHGVEINETVTNGHESTDDAQIQPFESDVLMTKICEMNENQNSTESGIISDNLVSSSADELDVLTAEVPEIEMEDLEINSQKLVSSVDVSGTCQKPPIETDTEKVTMITSESLMSELEKGNSVDIEGRDICSKPSTSTTDALSSDLVTQNDCLKNEKQLPDAELD